jgi:hypothetical protein
MLWQEVFVESGLRCIGRAVESQMLHDVYVMQLRGGGTRIPHSVYAMRWWKNEDAAQRLHRAALREEGKRVLVGLEKDLTLLPNTTK